MPFLDRLTNVQRLLSSLSYDALLVDDPINIFYLTGLQLSAGKLLIHGKGAYLIVDSRYVENCQKASPFPVLQLEKCPLDALLASEEFVSINSLAFDSDTTSHKEFVSLQQMVGKVNQSAWRVGNPLQLAPIDNPMKSLRNIKDAQEIASLREAADLGSQGFDFICGFLKEGVTELEVAIALEVFWKQRGGRNVAFDPIIAFGANSSMPHYRPGNQYLKLGDPVLVDIGVCLNHYHSDMTRMIFFGAPDPRIIEIHDIVEEAQQRALALCRPGALLGELDAAARDFISLKGYGPNFSHNLGHGVGLEIHEFPSIKNAAPFKDAPLLPGMIITIEPGIYLPGIGGVRIEDTILITPTGYESLTRRDTKPHQINFQTQR